MGKCAGSLTRRMGKKARHRILVLFSDSHCLKKYLMQYLAQKNWFTEVWTQEISGQTNMDSRLFTKSMADGAQHAWFQSMQDWLLMSHVDTLAVTTKYSFLSGFPVSASITANVKKEMYNLNTCTLVTRDSL